MDTFDQASMKSEQPEIEANDKGPNKAISQKQLEANRRNAQKSTGPRTEEGKARIAANAVKHGLTSRRFLLPNEDQSQFNAFLLDLCDQWMPRTNYEYILLHRMATCLWRLQRIPEIEAELLMRLGTTPEELLNTGEISLGKAFMQDTATSEGSFNRLARYESSLQRNLTRTTADLQRSLKKPLPDFMARENERAGLMQELAPEPPPPQQRSQRPQQHNAVPAPTPTPEQDGDPQDDEPPPTDYDAMNHDYLSQVARNYEGMSLDVPEMGGFREESRPFRDGEREGPPPRRSRHGHGVLTHAGSGGGNGGTWPGM